MAMATVRVSPGMLPPIINTTPNSPRVCTKVSTVADKSPGQASGSSTRHSVCQKESPLTAAASARSRGMASKARWMGCTMKGMLNTTEATTRPVKLKLSCTPKCVASQAPTGEAAPRPTSR